MNPEIFAEWLHRQGHKVHKTKSSYWYDQGPHVFQAFPYHWVITPQKIELSEFLHANKAIGLRYSTSMSAPLGKVSYHVICEDSSYSMASFPRKVRQDINKGLNHVDIKQIPISRLETDGWFLRQDTLIRQGRRDAENPAWWSSLCTSTKDLPGFEAWGALHKGKLVSSFLTFTCDDCFTLLYQQSSKSHLKYGINNAIFYSVTREAINRSGISKVFVALQSLDAPPTIDRFKFRMRFSAKPLRQRVVFHPYLMPFFNSGSHSLLKGILRLRPGNATLAKAEGMLRFYIQGKQPLSEQNWPPPLAARKDEFC